MLIREKNYAHITIFNPLGTDQSAGCYYSSAVAALLCEGLNPIAHGKQFFNRLQ